MSAFLMLLILAASLGSTAAAEAARFVPLGFHSPDAIESSARSVTPDGTKIVGYEIVYVTGDPNLYLNTPIRWTNETSEVLDLPPLAWAAVANSISSDGTRIAGTAVIQTASRPVLWQDSIPELLPAPSTGTAFEYEHAPAIAISADGRTIVGNGVYDTSAQTIVSDGVSWRDGIPARLFSLFPPIPDGNSLTIAQAVSGDGSVVVGVSFDRATRWTDGTIDQIATDSDGLTFALGVSDDGRTIVGSTTNNPTQRGFRWRNGVIDYFTGSTPTEGCYARATTGDGRIVVGSCGEGFIWDPVNGKRTLIDALMLEHGLDLSGWYRVIPWNISPDGRFLVGEGVNPQGKTEAWLAEIPPSLSSETLYVDDDACPGPGTGTQADPFCKVQDAVDTAYDGDAVIVQPGRYYENINMLGKNITLRSVDPLDPAVVEATILDGSQPVDPNQASVVTFTGTEQSDCVLDGLTITGGKGTRPQGAQALYGGGIYGAGTLATLRRCRVINNSLAEAQNYWDAIGAGVFDADGVIDTCDISANIGSPTQSDVLVKGAGIAYCDGLILDSVISDNLADSYFAKGAGAYMCNADFHGCTISRNFTRNWGGGCAYCSGTLDTCTIAENVAYEGGAGLWYHSGIIRNSVFRSNTGWGGGTCYACSGSIVDTLFEGNRSIYGMLEFQGQVERCTFRDNMTDSYGGALTLTGPTSVTECTFEGNQSWDGGAINIVSGLATIQNSQFKNNEATIGGAIYSSSGSFSVNQCYFEQNLSELGGAIYSGTGTVSIEGTLFVGNTACRLSGCDNGGAILGGADLKVTGCVFSGNQAGNGGAVSVAGDERTHITGNTFSGNSTIGGLGGGILFTGSAANLAQVSNSVFWMNRDGPGGQGTGQVVSTGGVPIVQYSLVEGGWTGPGTGNIDTDPLFIDADGADDIPGTIDDDLRLSANSPCIDAGANSAVPPEITVDLAGNPRFLDAPLVPDTGIGTPPVVDMGAYEFFPDCNENGVLDATDIQSGTSQDCDANGNPDECDADSDGDGVIDGCDPCPVDNPDDTDGDTVCDSLDACLGFDDLADGDGDGTPDGCDPCPADNPNDSDGDTVCDSADICAGFDDRIDTDSDGTPDGCDVCPMDNPNDTDGDGVCDSDDVCPGLDDALDADGDGNPDGCDPCPLDNPDDSDGDSVCDSVDVCPGFDDGLDADSDGVPDGCDPCPLDNPDDTDGDGACDSVDPCPLDNPDDSDGDGVCESADVCPGFDDNIDADGDGTPDGCDPCPLDNPNDSDGDGVCNSADICPGFDDAIDGDGDGQPDGCDPCPADNPDDSDGDTVCESADLCPGLDDRIDPDADGQPTGCDNCPLMPNAGQSDFDGNGVGDACELPLAVPGDVTKNRYVSFTPNSAATPVAFAVVHWESGATLYVGEPLTQPASIVGLGICRLVADPVFRDWSDTPIVHVAGCMIATNELYEVHTTADGINLSQPLLRITTPRPVDGRWWGDVVGGFTGPGGTPPNTWTAPDGFVNGLDIIAMVRSFESSESAPELVRVDVNPEVPDQAVNGNDILRVVNAFSIGSGREYYPYRVPMGTGPQGQSQCTLPE